MGDVEVTADLSGAFAKLDQLDQRLGRGLRTVLDGPVDRIVLGFFQAQFATAGAAGGTPWFPLAPTTLAFKRRHGREQMGILRFTNRLWASLTKRASPDGELTVTDSSYRRGTRVPYAVMHQQGYTSTSVFGVRRKNPPSVQVQARPLIPPGGLPLGTRAAIVAVIDRYLETGEAPA